MFGAQTCLFAKGTAELLKTTISGNNQVRWERRACAACGWCGHCSLCLLGAQLIYPVTYVILLCMLATIFLQTHWLATGMPAAAAPVARAVSLSRRPRSGLQYFDALYIVPVFQCFFISVSVAGGGVYYGEFRNFSALQAVCFFLGILVGSAHMPQRHTAAAPC